jgi:hypothetical protein
LLPISPLSTATMLPNPLRATRKKGHLQLVIGGQPALSSKRPARDWRQEREGTSDLRRHGDEVEFLVCKGWASSGCPVGASRRIFGAKPARGAGRDDRLTAAGRIPRKGVVRAARKTTVPRRAVNGRLVATLAGTGLPGRAREAGSGPTPKLGGRSALRSAARSKQRRGPGPPERSGEEATVFGLEFDDPEAPAEPGGSKGKAARLERSGSLGEEPGRPGSRSRPTRRLSE